MRIKQYDELIKSVESGKKLDDSKLDNADLFYAYYRSVWENGNATLDFGDVIWEDRVPELVDAMLAHGVRDFTISSRMSGIQNVIVAFMNAGDAELVGMKDVRTGHINPYTGDEEMAPAFILHLVDTGKF